MMDYDRDKQEQKQGMIIDGFSSQQEFYSKKILEEQEKKDESQKQEKKQVKFILPPPQQIKSKAYSLLPDRLTGYDICLIFSWGIKKEQPNPIPITFTNRNLDNLVIKMLQSPQKKYEIVYLGPRYENTFYAYRDKPFQFPYSHINLPKNIKYKKRPFLGQNPQVENTVQFDSIFESGNLDLAVKVNSHEYDLFLRVDSNTRGHFNWFNFVIRGLQVRERYKFNICNMERGFCLYTRGMKPYIKSLKAKIDKWRQSGLNVTYIKKQIRFSKHYGFELTKQWSLSFEIETQVQSDQIQICYCVPYTYSSMLKVIDQLRDSYESKSPYKIGKNIIKKETLCRSLGGLPIHLITISQFNKDQYKSNEKKCVIICGRVHPGESNGSFMMEGFLKFICGQSHQAKYLRKEVVFKIVPMLNPDGVVLGNYRTGLSGKDFNREYRNPDKEIFPEVYFFKKLVTETKLLYKSNLFMFLDLHGHSTKKNIFAYGPEFSLTDKFYYQARIFAKMLEKQNKLFRYHSCVFKVSEYKLTTARAILMKKMKIPLTYTIEASNGFYHDKQLLVSVPFQIDEWILMGCSIGKTISEYVECILSSQKIKKERQKAKSQSFKIRKQGSKGKSCNSPSLIKKQNSSIIIIAPQDDKIQKIYDEILQQQNQGPQEINSDDNISEGGSDKEDGKDDLSKKQLETLFSSIKNSNKLGKNKNKQGKVKKIDLTFGQDDLFKQQSDDDEQVQDYKPMFKIKKTLQMVQEKSHSPVQQVFIAQKDSFLSRKRRKLPNPPRFLSESKKKSITQFEDPKQNSSKIINYKFQEDKKSKFIETISIFPSFTFKSRNKIMVSSQIDNNNPLQKSARQFVISNIGTTPKQTKLIKQPQLVKTIDVVRHGSQLRNKLEIIGLDKAQKQNTYSKLNRSGFHHKERKTVSLTKQFQTKFHGFF